MSDNFTFFALAIILIPLLYIIIFLLFIWLRHKRIFTKELRDKMAALDVEDITLLIEETKRLHKKRMVYQDITKHMINFIEDLKNNKDKQ